MSFAELATGKIYYAKNKEKIAKRVSKWARENRTRRNLLTKAWRENNPEKYAAQKRAYYLRQKETGRHTIVVNL